MRELKSGPALTPLADLDTQRPFGLTGNGEGPFISTSVKFFAVTAFLWVGIIAGIASVWFSAWSLAVAFRQWMGA